MSGEAARIKLVDLARWWREHSRADIERLVQGAAEQLFEQGVDGEAFDFALAEARRIVESHYEREQKRFVEEFHGGRTTEPLN